MTRFGEQAGTAQLKPRERTSSPGRGLRGIPGTALGEGRCLRSEGREGETLPHVPAPPAPLTAATLPGQQRGSRDEEESGPPRWCWGLRASSPELAGHGKRRV